MGFLARIGTGVKRITDYFRDVWLELKKVRWPNRKELTSYSIVVFVTVIFVTIYFAILDLGISQMLDWILD